MAINHRTMQLLEEENKVKNFKDFSGIIKINKKAIIVRS